MNRRGLLIAKVKAKVFIREALASHAKKYYPQQQQEGENAATNQSAPAQPAPTDQPAGQPLDYGPANQP